MVVDILATSDLHGNLPEIKTPFDILCICGDICPDHDHYVSFQQEWMLTEFADWVKSLPFKDEFSSVVMTWGNHDFVGERANKMYILELKSKTDSRLEVLKNDVMKWTNGVSTVSIFGTPYCKIFGSWAFMVPDTVLDRKFKDIPDGLDILISHDSPTLNGLGMINEGYGKGTEAGNRVLDLHIQRALPRMFFSGHIHSGNHNFESFEGVMMANVSHIDETYTPRWEPLYVQYETTND